MNTNQKMTASELAVLWSQYINDSLSLCVLRHYIYHVQDDQIREILTYAKGLSEKHLKTVKQLFIQEDLPIPIGFTNDDVTVESPPIFTDTYNLVYIHIMAIHGLTRYAGAIGCSLREDIVQYFTQCTTETMELYDQSTKSLLEKGIISKPPVLNNTYEVDFVKKQSFLTGWFGNRRPINSIEISGTYLNLQKTMGKMVLELGFGQVAQTKEVRDYMMRARKVCQKHFELLSSTLKEDNLSIPKMLETEVTDSNSPPFSDKLMMFHISGLLSSAIGYYGEALSMCQRRDLSANYALMIADIGLLAEDGINILIKNGWFEQPPTAIDHEMLTKKK